MSTLWTSTSQKTKNKFNSISSRSKSNEKEFVYVVENKKETHHQTSPSKTPNNNKVKDNNNIIINDSNSHDDFHKENKNQLKAPFTATIKTTGNNRHFTPPVSSYQNNKSPNVLKIPQLKSQASAKSLSNQDQISANNNSLSIIEDKNESSCYSLSQKFDQNGENQSFRLSEMIEPNNSSLLSAMSISINKIIINSGTLWSQKK